MSFIEKHKAWVLPLLGAGLLGVGYMNYRTFQTEAPAEEGAAEPVPEAMPPEESTVPSEPSEGNAPADVWGDLQPFAVLPEELAQDDRLKDRARVALPSQLTFDVPLLLSKPSGAPLALGPVSPSAPAATSLAATTPPDLEFVVRGPAGSFAWFDGKAHRVGDPVGESGYTVLQIGTTHVVLRGPAGRRLEYTNPILVPSPSEEAP